MPTNVDPYEWIRRDKRRRLFQELRLLGASKWRDRFRLCICARIKYKYHFTIEAEVYGGDTFYTVQIVFPGNYPKSSPIVFLDQFVMQEKLRFLINAGTHGDFFNPDGSLRLEIPTGDAVSAVLILDQAEEWFGKFLSNSEKQ